MPETNYNTTPRLLLTLLCLIPLLLISCGSFSQGLDASLRKKLDSLVAQYKPQDSGSQQNYLLPNDVMTTMTIPSGWGGYGTYVFGGIGGSYPQVYHSDADLIASAGACVGNPFSAVNVAASINMTNVHEFSDFSGNLIVSRVLPRGSSLSAGALQLFASEKYSDSPGATYYIAFSHAVQSLQSETDGSSKLTYTIGVGNGRFYYKSPDDIAAGRGKYGTAVFGGLSYEVFPHFNLIAEWSGTNLGLSAGLRPLQIPVSFGFGVVNLTRYSADKPNAVFTVGVPLSLKRSDN